ncbi:hypothetical protein STENM223S_11451 [Streptomyces tendae]
MSRAGGWPTCWTGRRRPGSRSCPGTRSSPPGWRRCAVTCCGSWSRRPSAVRRWSDTGHRARATPCSTTAASGPTCCAYTVDRNPYKHGRFTPGTRIPILSPERIAADRPDYVLVLPVEPAGRAGRAALLRARVGRPAGLPHPGTEHCRGRVPRGHSMKVVLFCGGYGMRMRAGRLRRRAQADGDGRPAAADLARDALLRALRAQGVHSLPRTTAPTTSRSSSSTTRRRRPTTSCCAAAGPSCCPPT